MQKINAEQLITGLIKYITAEVIPNIDDTFTKLALKTFTISAANRADAYANVIHAVASKPFVADLLKAEDGCFEVESLIDAARQAVDECGELTVTIPPVRFISPQEKTLRFKAADLSTLKQYLTNAISEV